jgi:hypothetical protein
MPTSYPGALDNFTNPTGADNLSDAPVLHHSQHSNVNDAVKAIETELGTNPKGSNTSVRARLEAIEASLGTKLNSSAFHAPFGVATLDAGSMLVENVDAGKVTSGVLGVARIPNLSGAKILGTGSGGAAIPVDAVPLLAATQINSGVFALARIPGLPGSQITSGTIDAARLPTTVTSNANSQVVADNAARDAIPLGSRVNGMIVTVLNPLAQWTWRTDNSTWEQTGGPGAYNESPLEAYDATTLTTAITSFDPGAPGLSQVFTAPKSGKIYVTISSLIILTAGNTNGAGYFGAEVRQGNVIGSGTIVDSVATQKCVAVGGSIGSRGGMSMRYLVQGLTAGNQYHVRTMFTTSSSPTVTMQLFYRRVLVEMVH